MTSELMIFWVPSCNTLKLHGFQSVIKDSLAIWLLSGKGMQKADASEISVRRQTAKGEQDC